MTSTTRPETNTGVGVDLPPAAHNARTNMGRTLAALADETPVMLIFLRHFGCTFCREAAQDVAARRPTVEQLATIVFVHMGPPDRAERFFKRYGLEDIQHIHDPKQELYNAFDLPRGTLMQLFGPGVWLRGFVAGILKGHLVGPLSGDGFQMPGVFMLHEGTITRAFRHRNAGTRPEYCELTTAE
jgi:peroxiredoxin